MTAVSLRRFLLVAMPSGEIAIGLVGEEDALSIEIVPKHGEGSIGERLRTALQPYEADEVVALFPGPGRKRDRDADRYVLTMCLILRCPLTWRVHGNELERIEKFFASDANIRGKRFPSGAHETVHRLFSAHRTAALFDLTFGHLVPFTPEALDARYALAAESFAKEQHRVEALEASVEDLKRRLNAVDLTLAEREAKSADLN